LAGVLNSYGHRPLVTEVRGKPCLKQEQTWLPKI